MIRVVFFLEDGAIGWATSWLACCGVSTTSCTVIKAGDDVYKVFRHSEKVRIDLE
jgi:hypothetical protein